MRSSALTGSGIRLDQAFQRFGIGLMLALVFAAEAAAQSAINQIVAVSPTSAVQGVSGLTVTFTLDTDPPQAPPVQILPSSATIGGLSGSSLAHPSSNTVTAVFSIPSGEVVGAKAVAVQFPGPLGTITFTNAAGFTVASAATAPPTITTHPQSQSVPAGAEAVFTVAAFGAAPLFYQWQKDAVNLPGAVTSAYTLTAVSAIDTGAYRCVVSNAYGTATSLMARLTLATEPPYAGYNLFSPLASTNTYLLNNNGATVHTWSSHYRPGQSVYLLEDGTLLRTASSGTAFNAGGAGGRVERFDWDGDLRWAFDYSTTDHRLHHDIAPLPNGHILMIAWERKTQAEAEAAGRDPSLLSEGELWPDTLIEVAPTGSYGGEIVWVWRVWDHLVQDYDAGKPDYGIVSNHPGRIDLNYVMSGPSGGGADWTHINAVDYHAELDQILLSVHNFSEVWIIDHGTTSEAAAGPAGDLLYRWGNPQAYERGGADDQQLFVQHDARWIPADCPGAGRLLVFNNGQGRPAGNYSSVDEFVPPLAPDGTYSNALPYAPSTTAWSYAATPPGDFYAMNISGAQRLPDGHTLICNGPTGLFFEVTADGETVWSYDFGASVFRVTRYGYDYAGFAGTGLNPGEYPNQSYAVVDTSQALCYNHSTSITAPAPGQAFAGQDAQYAGGAMSYTLAADGRTVYDQVTGLTWQRSPDTSGDGVITASDKLTYSNALLRPAFLNATNYGGYSDWRLPTIKELYSLIDFRGTDPSGYSGSDLSILTPFIHTSYFEFAYGQTNAGERVIDAQYASCTRYVSEDFDPSLFGVNFADGRIKGYGLTLHGVDKTFFVQCVRGNTNYGINAFRDNDDGTVTDHATGLTWQQADSGIGLNWSNALAYAENLSLAGYQDWRLPNAKELQSLLDYTRSPDTTASAAIDPIFQCTPLTNENGQTDYPWYWSSTTHAQFNGSGAAGAYVCFGRGMGYMNSTWVDVHGAGCQRSDPKGGSLSGYTYVSYGYYNSQAPQGDAVRIFNFVRCVRGGAVAPTNDTDADGLTDWYEYDYATDPTALTPDGDLDGDGFSNLAECGAGTSPVDAESLLVIRSLDRVGMAGPVITWPSVWGQVYRLQGSTNLVTDAFSTIVAAGIDATPPVNTYTTPVTAAEAAFYRVGLDGE